MSVMEARKKRIVLFASIALLFLIVGLVSLISVEDPGGATLRIGIIMVTLGAGFWMQRSWEIVPVALLAWLVPNFGRSLIDDAHELFATPMMLELPGVLAIAACAAVGREMLRTLEGQTAPADGAAGVNPETGVFEASQLRPALASELARSRRFGRTFSLVLVGIDEKRQKFDYRDSGVWEASLAATTRLLRNTRHNVDRVFHHGSGGFAIILPESSEKDVVGMVRRLRRLARLNSPAEGEPGGPLPAHYGATFFPSCATTVDDLFRRAEIALKIAEHNTARYQLDGAEAPELPPAETLRRPDEEVALGRGPASTVLVEASTVLFDEVPVVVYAEEIAAEKEFALASEPEPILALVPVFEPEPIVAVTETTSEPAMAGARPAIGPFEAGGLLREIDALLKQMDETLSLIRSVRASAA